MARIALASVDKKPRNKWRGHFAYLFNKAVGGKMDQGIIAVWYAWITAESGNTIYGNNPLNLTCSKGDGCYPGQIGHYRFAGNSRNFAAFATPQDGANAVARLLTIRQYRYPAITLAAQRGDWQAMADAISKSCWVSCARPGYVRNGVNSLYSLWNGLRKTVAAEFASIPKGAPGVTVPSVPPDARPGGTLGAFNNIVNLPVGHILTAADVNDIMSKLDKAGWFDGQFGTTAKAVSMAIVRTILRKYIGQPWNKDMQDKLQVDFRGAAGLAGTTFNPVAAGNPLEALGTLAALFARLFDPQTYVRTGALLLGLILALTGFKMLIDASGGAPVA